jgi:hypothetical protein
MLPMKNLGIGVIGFFILAALFGTCNSFSSNSPAPTSESTYTSPSPNSSYTAPSSTYRSPATTQEESAPSTSYISDEPSSDYTNSDNSSDSSDQSLSNDETYTNVDGDEVHSPAYSKGGSAPEGATAECSDGTYSFSRHRQGTCSHHGGVAEWLQ